MHMALIQSNVFNQAARRVLISTLIIIISLEGSTLWVTCQQNVTPGRRAPFYCYKCTVLDGIDNPICEYPVARKALAASCFSKRCIKLQIYSQGYKDGQALKSWVMKRDCFVPSLITEEYGGLEPPCSSCARANGSVRIFQRLNAELRGNAVRSIFAQDLDYKIIMMCKCCNNLCNFEEGFNLTYFNDKKVKGKSAAGLIKGPSFLLLFLVAFNFLTLRIVNLTY